MDKLSERLAVVGTVDPDANAAGTFYTDAIDMSLYNEVMFVLLAGEQGNTGSVDLSVTEQSIAGTGSGSSAVPGKSITALTTGSNDNQAIIHVRADDLSERYVFGQMVVADATGDSAVIAIAGAPRYHPASDNDLASVAEIVD